MPLDTNREVPTKRSGGVADYFAILGVGEKLIWKHTQKQSHDGSHTEEEEDEAALMERFYREIVEVAILMTDGTIKSSHSCADDMSSQEHSCASSSHRLPATAQPKAMYTKYHIPVPIPDSPGYSDATTTLTAQESRLERAILSQTVLDGFTSVTKTLPAGRPSRLSGDQHVWSKLQVFDANLDPCFGFRQELLTKLVDGDTAESHDHIRGIGRKVGSTLRSKLVPMMDRFRDKHRPDTDLKKFHIGFRRRLPDEGDRPAVADLAVHYVRLHRDTIVTSKISDTESVTTSESTTTGSKAAALKRGLVTGAVIAARVAEAGKQKLMQKYRRDWAEQLKSPTMAQSPHFPADRDEGIVVPLHEVLTLPDGFDEWSIPEEYQWLKFPSERDSRSHMSSPTGRHVSRSEQSKMRKTFLVPHKGDMALESNPSDDHTQASEPSGAGMEAYLDNSLYLPSPPSSSTGASEGKWTNRPRSPDSALDRVDPGEYMPRMLSEPLPSLAHMLSNEDFCYIPVLAVRRQRVGDEERYHEDPGVVELAVTFDDGSGNPVMPNSMESFDDEEDSDCNLAIFGMTDWSPSSTNTSRREGDSRSTSLALGSPVLLVKRNKPIGLADAAFATRVLDRFPVKNYKDLPLPEEELPMFCYPTGCRLHRAKYSDAPLPQFYGFVVKNERGHSIHVSCVSFMEPLTSTKVDQLAAISQRRRRVSLPHRRFSQRKDRAKVIQSTSIPEIPFAGVISEGNWLNDDDDDDGLLTGFDDMVTFENKTICLISRHPFWTAFRKFLSHLHILSGSSSDLPLERCISHLLLTVPLPKPGGPCVIVPLPALNGPMVLSFPPAKDLPLVDLPYHRLLACLDVPTIVTIVLGFLALERKLIIMSTRPSLVLDVCELLKSLLFPFELCAPYVPRLTQPFMSCLEFPGAIFVGIHDDKTPDGLAAIVRGSLPEDSAIVDLDTGAIDCSGDKQQILKQCWSVVPSGPRSMLVSEIETLCRDAGVVPGLEPLDSQMDSAFAGVPNNVVDDMDDRRGNTQHEPLDDRAVRDSFIRFFCSVLGGYERYLVVPDVDFMTSGNEWFDTQGFLAGVSSESAAFLGSLVNTQLFQSFVQRRTEASDVHCLLFDDCLAEYHSSPIPFGRLGGDVETLASSDEGQPQMLYSLLVDQCSAEPFQSSWDEGDANDLDRTFDGSMYNSEIPGTLSTSSTFTELTPTAIPNFFTNPNGDLVTVPSRNDLANKMRFIYCVDGNPCFPHKLTTHYFLPQEPDSLLGEVSEAPLPLLARSEREVEEAQRRRKTSTTYRGLRNQRRCLWQLPKLMGSHFLGTWLMCIPSQVAQSQISEDDQTRYLLRALGALRLLRHRLRIIPDEASYRALMVACGRINSDRRTELVKLFGLLRSDGIFPSAVTLGQYTRALAEGYNKRSTGLPDIDHNSGGVEVMMASSSAGTDAPGQRAIADFASTLNSLDSSLEILEDSGRRWRHRSSQARENGPTSQQVESDESKRDDTLSQSIDTSVVSLTKHTQKSAKKKKSAEKLAWLPVMLSSSFVPVPTKGEVPPLCKTWKESTKLLAIWSRTAACDQCSYIPLDEEIQSGWDVIEGGNVPSAIACPRCGSLILPKLGYKEMSLQEAFEVELNVESVKHTGTQSNHVESEICPPQIVMSLPEVEPEPTARVNIGHVTYISPAALRSALEKYVFEQGECVLDRETLRHLDPEVFYNFWWYCCRFSLPLPLSIKIPEHANSGYPYHVCASAAWDKNIAERGCRIAARNIYRRLGWTGPASHEIGEHKDEIGDMHDELPLLARFNLQALSQSDWDHKDLSEILVALVGACDKRNFVPVLECAMRCNTRRKDAAGIDVNKQEISSDDLTSTVHAANESFDVTNLSDSVELDCYRTILYLAKYQCTTAFHIFFPAATKACKGYHFWCAFGTPMPIFDRLFRDAVKEIRNKDNSFIPVHDVSDVALGFRCVFGHLI